MDFPAWHNPDNLTLEQFGWPEWRGLMVGEQVIDGDEFFSLQRWTKLNDTGYIINIYNSQHRRRNSKLLDPKLLDAMIAKMEEDTLAPPPQPALPSKRFQIRLMLAPHVFVFRVYAASSALAKEILISLLKDEMTCEEIPHKSDAL